MLVSEVSALGPVVSEVSVLGPVVSEVSSGRAVTNLDIRPRPNCFLTVVDVNEAVEAVVVDTFVGAVVEALAEAAAAVPMSTGTSPEVGGT